MRAPFYAKYCGTCRNWSGRQDVDMTNKKVEFNENEAVKCPVVRDGSMKRGGVQTSCPKWEQRFR